MIDLPDKSIVHKGIEYPIITLDCGLKYIGRPKSDLDIMDIALNLIDYFESNPEKYPGWADSWNF